MSNDIINDEFCVRMNVQKMGFIAVDENDIPRLSEYMGIDKNRCNDIIDKIQRNVKELADPLIQKYKQELDRVKDVGQKKVIFIGDSNTSERGSHLNIIKAVFKGLSNIEIIDSAVSADTSKELVNRSYPTIFNFKANVAILMIGTNDCKKLNDSRNINLVSEKEFEKNLDYLISILKENNTKIIINTIPYVDNERFNTCFGDFNWSYYEEDTDRYNKAIISAAERHEIILSDYRAKFRGLAYDAYLCADGIHLNNLGQTTVAENELQFIFSSLKAKL